MKRFLVACVFSVLLVSPAWADDIGSATLDWSSLTFSGVEVDVRAFEQGASASLLNNALEPPDITGLQYGFPQGTLQVSQDVSSLVAAAQAASVTTAQTGTSTGSVDLQSFTASANVHGVGYSNSAAGANEVLVAHTTGNLTITMSYTITNDFGPTGTGHFPDAHARTTLTLGLDDHYRPGQYDSKVLYAPGGSSVQSGTLSVTQWLTAGVATQLIASTQLEVNNPGTTRTVPIPDMLWPALMSLIFAGWVVRWRWTRERLGFQGGQ